MNLLTKLEKEGITLLNKLDESSLSQMIIQANDAYYNKTQVIEDSTYDILKEYVENKYPENKTIHEIGAPIEKKKVLLPYELWSQNKLKSDTSSFANWFKKHNNPKVVSAKLNGVSALYTTEFDGKRQLFTRGDGKRGKDISHLIPFLDLPKEMGQSVRGELLITKEAYQTEYSDGKYSNSLSWLVGLTGLLKNYSEKAQHLDFVAYEVIYPVLKPSRQMSYLKDKSFDIVHSNSVIEHVGSLKHQKKLADEIISLRLLS